MKHKGKLIKIYRNTYSNPPIPVFQKIAVIWEEDETYIYYFGNSNHGVFVHSVFSKRRKTKSGYIWAALL